MTLYSLVHITEVLKEQTAYIFKIDYQNIHSHLQDDISYIRRSKYKFSET
jgi:23S rRNA maturation-related 3'-5' exoribonuclease YhaM